MGYTKTIELSIDSSDIANQIADTVADYINDAIREYYESNGFPTIIIDDILADNDLWNGVIEELMPQLKV